MTSPGAESGRVPVRRGLEHVEPYGAPQLDVEVRLNTNETATPPPSGFLDRVTERLRSVDLNRYPDRDHLDLRAALAARHGVDPSAVWAANGSNEVLIQLLQAYGGPGRTALSLRPSYSMYPELCRTALTPLVTVDLDEALQVDAAAVLAAVDEHDPDLVLFASPNNPTGTPIRRDVIRAVHDATVGLVVVDEAYVEFAPPSTSVVDLVGELSRLVVVRTFSKAFRLAGLRLGYLVASAWVVEDLQKVRLPYHLDAITQVAGIVALDDEESFLEHRAQVASERQRLVSRLLERPGVEVFESVANFVLVRTDVDGLFDRLLAHGVLVRDFSTRPRLAGCVRVTIGTPEENDAFIRALDAIRDDV
ncbi:MAG: histidinol-phosphate transaminase [Nitriliruptoraceae bacterium]